MAGKRKPKHELDDVKALAPRRSLVLAKSRALDPLCVHCGTPKGALAFARKVIAAIEDTCFSETVMQCFDREFDIYGRQEDGITWFIKLAIDLDTKGDEYLLVLSFHPAEGPIRTTGGELKP